MRTRGDTERGSTLVLALIWMVVFSILVGGFLQSMASDQSTITQLGQNDDEMLAADSGLATAVAHIRSDPEGELGSYETCPETDPLVALEGAEAVSGYDIKVWCVPAATSGYTIVDDSLPGYSAVALDHLSLIGVASTVRFEGSVYINENDQAPGWFNIGQGPMIAVDKGSFTLSEWATGGTGPGNDCGFYDGTDPKLEIVADDFVLCDPAAGDKPDPEVGPNEPGEPPPASWDVPFTWEPDDLVDDPADPSDPFYHRTVPDCLDAVNGVITFKPGFYTEGDRLNDLFTGDDPATPEIEGCPDTIFWFDPDWTNPDPKLRGNFLFDLQDVTDGKWVIEDSTARIVVGEPKGWDPADASPDPSFPGACMLEEDYELAGTPAADRAGVVIVFGGETGLSQSAGQLEMCPIPSETGMEFSFYQLKEDYPAAGLPDSYTATLRPAMVAHSAPVPGWQNDVNALAIDGADMTWSPTDPICSVGDNPCDLTAQLMDYSPAIYDPALMPAGTLLTKAQLDLDMTMSDLDIRAGLFSIEGEVTFADGITKCTFPIPERNDPEPFELDLLILCGGQLTTSEQLELMDIELRWNNVTCIHDFGVQTCDPADPQPTVTLDGLEILVESEPPHMRAGEGCAVSAVPWDWLRCPVLGVVKSDSAVTSPQAAIFGTIYAPLGVVRVIAGVVNGPVVRRGVVAGRLTAVKLADPGTVGVPLISVPKAETLDRDVILLVFTEPSDGSGGSRLRIEALVTIDDGGGAQPGETAEVKYYKPCNVPGTGESVGSCG